MSTSDNQFIAMLARSRTLDEVRSAGLAFCRSRGASYFLYCACFPGTFTRPLHVSIGDIPEQVYGCGAARPGALGNTLLDYFHARSTPEIWSVRTLHLWHAAARHLFANMHELGASAAAVIPTRGARGISSVLCLVSCDEQDRAGETLDRALPQACLFAFHLQSAVERVLPQELRELIDVRLTKRERECLSWTADGKTALEIAQILGIGRRTVIYHLQNATSKLKAVNRYQAIARAAVLGLMRPQCHLGVAAFAVLSIVRPASYWLRTVADCIY